MVKLAALVAATLSADTELGLMTVLSDPEAVADPPPETLTWANSGDVSFELTPKGNEVLLTLIHRRLPDRATILKVSAGWHMHLDILVARATGEQPGPFWDGWERLRTEYDARTA